MVKSVNEKTVNFIKNHLKQPFTSQIAANGLPNENRGSVMSTVSRLASWGFIAKTGRSINGCYEYKLCEKLFSVDENSIASMLNKRNPDAISTKGAKTSCIISAVKELQDFSLKDIETVLDIQISYATVKEVVATLIKKSYLTKRGRNFTTEAKLYAASTEVVSRIIRKVLSEKRGAKRAAKRVSKTITSPAQATKTKRKLVGSVKYVSVNVDGDQVPTEYLAESIFALVDNYRNC